MPDFDDLERDYGGQAVREALSEAEFAGQPFAPLSAYEGEAAIDLLPLIDMAALAGREPPHREWIVKSWIPSLQATYLTGPGSAGKSLLSQQLCTCIALGLPFLGLETRATGALYLTCEDDRGELERRQKDICESLDVDRSALAGKLHLVSLQGELQNELVSFDDRDMMRTTSAYARLEATALKVGVGFIALDNVAHLTSDEIARNRVAAFVNVLNRLALKVNGAVLFLGHPNKPGQQYSGSTSWENQVRARLYMEEPKDTDSDLKSLTRAKANYARRGEKLEFRWYRGAFVREGDLPPDTARELAETAAAAEHNARFLTCLAEMTRQQRHVSERPGANYAPKVFSTMPEAKGSKREDLTAAMDRLFRIGRIERAELWRGSDRKIVSGLRETQQLQLEGLPQ